MKITITKILIIGITFGIIFGLCIANCIIHISGLYVEMHQVSVDTTDIKQMLQDADKCTE